MCIADLSIYITISPKFGLTFDFNAILEVI